MAKMLTVNNYPTRERFERLVTALRGTGAEVETADWKEASARKFNASDGVVLSGSPDMMSEPSVQEKFAGEIEAIRESSSPLLGICFGHQMIAHAFGTEIVKDREHVLRMVETTVLQEDPLFAGLPKSLMLLESRQEVVKCLPAGFKLLARSSTSEVAAMRFKSRLVYGVQSHPERFTRENPEGKAILANFLRLVS